MFQIFNLGFGFLENTLFYLLPLREFPKVINNAQEQKLENNFDNIAPSNAWLKPLTEIFCFSFKKQTHSEWFLCKIRDIS